MHAAGQAITQVTSGGLLFKTSLEETNLGQRRWSARGESMGINDCGNQRQRLLSILVGAITGRFICQSSITTGLTGFSHTYRPSSTPSSTLSATFSACYVRHWGGVLRGWNLPMPGLVHWGGCVWYGDLCFALLAQSTLCSLLRHSVMWSCACFALLVGALGR